MRPLVILLMFAAACDYGFEKQSHISKLRVLAVQAEPAEIAIEPGQSAPEVRLTALAVDPSGAPIAIEYALCDAVGLPDPDLACPGVHGHPLESTDAVSARIDLAPLASQITLRMPSEIPAVPIAVGFNATAGQERLHGFATINLRTSAGRPVNLNPALDAVAVDGAAIAPDGTTSVRAGTKVHLTPMPAADAAEMTETGLERLVFSFYATDGDIDSLRSTNLTSDGIEVDPEVDWTAPKVAGPVRLWVVVRDGRGGVGWLARTVQVVP